MDPPTMRKDAIAFFREVPQDLLERIRSLEADNASSQTIDEMFFQHAYNRCKIKFEELMPHIHNDENENENGAGLELVWDIIKTLCLPLLNDDDGWIKFERVLQSKHNDKKEGNRQSALVIAVRRLRALFVSLLKELLEQTPTSHFDTIKINVPVHWRSGITLFMLAIACFEEDASSHELLPFLPHPHSSSHSLLCDMVALRGGNTTKRDSFGDDIVMYAVKHSASLGALNWILHKYGAEVVKNAKAGGESWNVVLLSARNDRVDILDWCVSQFGEDFVRTSVTEHLGWNDVIVASRFGSCRVLDWCMTTFGAAFVRDSSDSYKRSFITHTIQSGQFRVLRWAIEHDDIGEVYVSEVRCDFGRNVMGEAVRAHNDSLLLDVCLNEIGFDGLLLHREHGMYSESAVETAAKKTSKRAMRSICR